MKLLHYVLLIHILWLNYCSVVQGDESEISTNHVPRVWNGNPATLGQFPYQVGLMQLLKPVKQGVYATFCGGAIIGKKRVLTAAHCLAPDDTRSNCDKCCNKPKPVPTEANIKKIRIVAGNIKSVIFSKDKKNAKTYQMRSISKYRYPDKYDFPENDVCVIFVNKIWKFDTNVGELPYASKHIDYGSKVCKASGFGILNKNPNKPTFSETMMWADLQLIPEKACKRKHKTQMKKFVCSVNTEKDVTQGDSGGPLVCKNTGDPREADKGIIVGVVCGDSKLGNFFTRVSSYTKFVDSAACKIACPQFCIFIGPTLFLLNP